MYTVVTTVKTIIITRFNHSKINVMAYSLLSLFKKIIISKEGYSLFGLMLKPEVFTNQVVFAITAKPYYIYSHSRKAIHTSWV